jgi:hypothetical protein
LLKIEAPADTMSALSPEMEGDAVTLPHWLPDPRAIMSAFLLLVSATSASTVMAMRAEAESSDRDPIEFALTNEEAGGKFSYLVKDEDCSESRARCVYRRWERDGETDQSVGPIVTANKVWVAKDERSALDIYAEQAEKQVEFPEQADYAKGPFKFELPRDKEGEERLPPADQWTGLSACIKNYCDSGGRIDLHQRMVARKRNVITMVYLFGRARNSTRELTVYFITRVMDRV